MEKKKEFDTSQLTWEEEQYGSYILRTEVFDELNKLIKQYKERKRKIKWPKHFTEKKKNKKWTPTLRFWQI